MILYNIMHTLTRQEQSEQHTNYTSICGLGNEQQAYRSVILRVMWVEYIMAIEHSERTVIRGGAKT